MFDSMKNLFKKKKNDEKEVVDEKVKDKAEKQLDELIQSSSSDQNTTSKSSSTSFYLENAKRMTLEMEQSSIGIMRGLEENNQKLGDVNNKVISLNGELDDSNGIMTRILKKENRNKLVIAGFCIVLTVAFIAIIYYKFN